MSLYSTLYICIAACLFSAISGNDHKQQLKDHFHHLSSIANFECVAPQPRLLHVHDIFADDQLHGKAYFPEVTVLHRCDRHVGSCNDATFRCGPTHVTNISLPFKITFLEAMHGHAKGQWVMEYHHLANHTSCGCHKAETSPPFSVPHTKPVPTADNGNYIPPDSSYNTTQQSSTYPTYEEATQKTDGTEYNGNGYSGGESYNTPQQSSSYPPYEEATQKTYGTEYNGNGYSGGESYNNVDYYSTTTQTPLNTDTDPQFINDEFKRTSFE